MPLTHAQPLTGHGAGAGQGWGAWLDAIPAPGHGGGPRRPVNRNGSSVSRSVSNSASHVASSRTYNRPIRAARSSSDREIALSSSRDAPRPGCLLRSPRSVRSMVARLLQLDSSEDGQLQDEDEQTEQAQTDPHQRPNPAQGSRLLLVCPQPAVCHRVNPPCGHLWCYAEWPRLSNAPILATPTRMPSSIG